MENRLYLSSPSHHHRAVQARFKTANCQRANGLDPKEVQEQQAERERLARLHTFELLARAWQASAKKDRQRSDDYGQKVIRHLEIHVFPWVGHIRTPVGKL